MPREGVGCGWKGLNIIKKKKKEKKNYIDCIVGFGSALQ